MFCGREHNSTYEDSIQKFNDLLENETLNGKMLFFCFLTYFSARFIFFGLYYQIGNTLYADRFYVRRIDYVE